jgi:hypothetical protein
MAPELGHAAKIGACCGATVRVPTRMCAARSGQALATHEGADSWVMTPGTRRLVELVVCTHWELERLLVSVTAHLISGRTP